jgi:glycosyltransferase involved in cell wall biosynthesis
LFDELKSAGFNEIPEFKLTSFFNAHFVAQVRRFAAYLKENKIDVVQTHDFYTNVFGMAGAYLARTPVRIAAKRETGGMRSAAQKTIEKMSFQLAHAVVANSEAVKSYLVAEGVSRNKIQTVYNGLDLERLKPADKSRAELANELGLDDGADAKIVTMVANLRHEEKNQPMFIRTAARVAERFPDVLFVLAGEGELQPALEELAKELNAEKNVRFIGRCTRVPDLLSISDACILTSFNEGFSNSILEYMAASKPVVATKVGGAAEAIIEGETGYLVASDDDAAMSEKLISLLENSETAAEFGRAGRKIVESRFSCDAQLETTLSLYQRFLNK